MAGTSDVTNDFGSSMLKRIEELEKRSGIKLGTMEKILLAETGTIEQILSVFIGSRVRVEVTSQRERGGVIERESVITNSRQVLIRARSRILTRNLPVKVVKLIRSKRKGIGTIIQNSRIETFRNILEVGYDPQSRNVFRRYHITYKKRVAFEIREEFSVDKNGGQGVIR